LSGANHAEAANYPFCTIDPSEFFCVVPDKNFSYLVDVFKPSSIVPAALKVTDIAGLIKGASEGAGLGNAFLSHIAAVDGIYHLVRGFESDEVIHVDDSVDPVRDMETIVSELCLKDLAVLSTVINTEKDRIRKEKGKARAVDVPVGEVFQEAYDKCLALLESRTPIQTCETFTAGHVELIRDWGLITTKPVIYVVNLSQPNFIKKGSKWLPKIKQWVDSHGGGQIIPVSVDFEEACVAKSNESPEALQGTSCVRVYTHMLALVLKCSLCIATGTCTATNVSMWCHSKTAFLDQCSADAKAAGLQGPNAVVRSMVPRLIRAGRQALCLQSFYTAGPKEVRAWTIMQGTLAPQAAGVIHTDFERGFIKAEVAAFDDFKALHGGQASMAKVKEAGKYRQEGKQYVMQDGDIVVFMHNTTTAAKKK
jgi:GTP-binding protein YchF